MYFFDFEREEAEIVEQEGGLVVLSPLVCIPDPGLDLEALFLEDGEHL